MLALNVFGLKSEKIHLKKLLEKENFINEKLEAVKHNGPHLTQFGSIWCIRN